MTKKISKQKVMVSGSQGFIGGYIVNKLLQENYEVVGIDNFSKYGRVYKGFETHPNFTLIDSPIQEYSSLSETMAECDHFIAGAALIGGISYFHKIPYDLLAQNEAINIASVNAAIEANKSGKLKKITMMSSSMVYESSENWPHLEGSEITSPVPKSSYGFQKLACEYFVKSASEQYGLPYTILRPFNVVGTGEFRSLNAESRTEGDVKLSLSHVVPDLVTKILLGQNPIQVLGDGNQIRHYTNGADLATAVELSLNHPSALNEDFNISSPIGHRVIDVLRLIWKIIYPSERLPQIKFETPFEHDVQTRIPSVEKAKNILGFEANITLEESLDEVIPWVQDALKKGLL